jgi:hypothetical protein
MLRRISTWRSDLPYCMCWKSSNACVAMSYHPSPGRWSAQGSLQELRAGVESKKLLQGRPANSARKLTLEEIFLHTVGGSGPAERELSWLG